jgi:serine/threonine-protein kinase
MLMEFVDGETLEQRLKNGPLPVPQAVEYVSQILSALEYAHARGVIHRDIKPANMMLTPGGSIKLMDFGIAKASADRRLTMTGTTMGSLYYMSPEQIQGAADLDARADLYSVGVSLYELVTGKRPFDGDSQFAIMSAHLEKQPVPPITLDPKMPGTLNEAILMSVAKDPKQRFQTAAAFRAALGSVAKQVAPAPVKPAVQAAPAHAAAAATPAKGRRGLWVAAGGLAAVLAVVAFIQFGPKKETSAAPQMPIASPVQSSAPPTQTLAPTTPAQTTPAQTSPDPAQRQVQQSQPPAASTRKVAPNAQQPATFQQQTPPAQQQTQQTQQPPAPVAQPPVQQQAPPQQPSRPAVDPARQAALQKVREDLVMLQTRAAGCRSGMQAIQRSQASSGMGLRGDMQEASSLMGSFLEGAVSALNAGDAASARGFMDKAERNIEKLEKFLGR